MAREADEGVNTFLDRMEHIAEEEDEGIEPDEEGDEVSTGPERIFRVDEGDDEESEEESEEDDEFVDEFIEDDDWLPETVEEGSETASFSSGPHFSGLSLDEGTGESSAFHSTSSDEASMGVYNKRGSFKSTNPRRRSFNLSSAGEGLQSQPTNSSISQGSRRRPSVMLKSPSISVAEDEEKKLSINSSGGRASRARSVRRSSISAPVSSATGKSSMDMALSRLTQEGNTASESVAAAAQVVQLSDSKRSYIQFAVNDYALVLIHVLNITGPEEIKDAFTVNPVNKFGYPRGEGKTAEEQKGPYTYVLVTVKKRHFDDTRPYYTVIRADCGTEQRADTGWMERIEYPKAIEAARRAATQTKRSELENDNIEKEDKSDFWKRLSIELAWPVYFATETVIPLLRIAIRKTKEQITLILYGSNPYYCKIRLTGINLLVGCSILYLFLDVMTLAFLPASADYVVAIVGCFVWSILCIELILEWLNRPEGYYELILSEKSYAPSTARYIDSVHLIFETLSLLLYIPEFLRFSSRKNLHRPIPVSYIWSSIRAIIGPSKLDSALGRFFIGFRTLRMFSLIRHWKNLWINSAFDEKSSKRSRIANWFIQEDDFESNRFSRKFKSKAVDEMHGDEFSSTDEDQRLKKAATIGTALMVVNSRRALFILLSIMITLPMIETIHGVNSVTKTMTNLLHEIANTSNCTELQQIIKTLRDGVIGIKNDTNIIFAQIENSYCENVNGTIINDIPELIENITAKKFAEELGIRQEGIIVESRNDSDLFIEIFYNKNDSISRLNAQSFFQLLLCFILVLVWLTILRVDAGRLVLHPLQRMLKIIVRYAKSPLSPTFVVPKTRYKRKKSLDYETGYNNSGDDTDKDGNKEELGNYETEQLINAISKIADLLRKCWGVAGAGIISTNLARTQDGKTVVFNPTIPGKRVYALFGFVMINEFSDQINALDRDVMILINDIAKVVHDEIYRWALGNSGQCNKNLGSSFLLVFRIGDFDEVKKKLNRAREIIFTSKEKRKRKATTLRRRRQRHRGGSLMKSENERDIPLSSLPGIQSFSDRALLGMLKSFAGIHRDHKLLKWKSDFRLGAGVGAYTVNIIIGMDAGWAVEGAVGSEYKIDATYLSPHVNMAARMMSATKQYGVTMLLSQAVEELLSSQARSKLRHLDTVYVKGSSVAQRIFTYDARHRGVDFFLFERSPEQAEADAEGYLPTVWELDKDLQAMRQHVTDDFVEKFNEGKDLYLAGKWKKAIEILYEADDIMVTTVLEEGYLDYCEDDVDVAIFDRVNTTEENTRIRNEHGDGACKCLIAYMEKRNGIPPPDWKGVKPLTSK